MGKLLIRIARSWMAAEQKMKMDNPEGI